MGTGTSRSIEMSHGYQQAYTPVPVNNNMFYQNPAQNASTSN